jgi:hypothetical protein
MNEIALASIAILEVNWDRGNDYIEGFVPFVAEALRLTPQNEVALGQLQQTIRESSGLNIPQSALMTILARARKQGLVELKHKIYQKNEAALAGYDLARIRSETLRKVESLVGSFLKFCGEEFGKSPDQEEAEEAILSLVDARSIPILSAAVDGAPLVTEHHTSDRLQFYVSAYAKRLCDTDPTLFRYLEDIVKGTMLANVLVYPNIGKVQQKFDRVDVYLDTPLVLRIIGLATPELQAPTKELLHLLYRLSARLCCFEHTVYESKRVLSAISKALASHSISQKAPYYETDEYLMRQGVTSGHIELMISKLEVLLRQQRITIKPKPEHTRNLTVDEDALEILLQRRVGYRYQESLHHDLDSLTAIHRIRRGQIMNDLESCRAILVTSNKLLAQVAAEFFAGRGGVPFVPPFILDHVLATLAWLKCPDDAPELPKKVLIASCSAAYQPSDSLWRSYLDRIDQLRKEGSLTDDDYAVLRYSMEARRILMDVTAGDPTAFAEGTPADVLARAREAIRAESEKKAETEMKKRLHAERLVFAAADRDRQYRDRVEVIASTWGQRISYGVFILVFIALGLGIWTTLPKPFPQMPSGWKELIGPIILFILLISSLLNIAFGITLERIRRTLDLKTTHFIQNRMLNAIGLNLRTSDKVDGGEV